MRMKYFWEPVLSRRHPHNASSEEYLVVSSFEKILHPVTIIRNRTPNGRLFQHFLRRLNKCKVDLYLIAPNSWRVVR